MLLQHHHEHFNVHDRPLIKQFHSHSLVQAGSITNPTTDKRE
jgi:hypothetical protein